MMATEPDVIGQNGGDQRGRKRIAAFERQRNSLGHRACYLCPGERSDRKQKQKNYLRNHGHTECFSFRKMDFGLPLATDPRRGVTDEESYGMLVLVP